MARVGLFTAILAPLLAFFPIGALAAGPDDFCSTDTGAFSELAELDAGIAPEARRQRRMVCADVAAIDQMLVYNRFGSHNPFGMIFALTRDLIPASEGRQDCGTDMGMHARREGLEPGAVRLSDCKRPRPLTLRANVGDVLHVRLRNYLRHAAPDGRPDYSQTFCRQAGEPAGTWRARLRALVSEGAISGADAAVFSDAGGVDATGAARLVSAMCAAGSDAQPAELATGGEATDWPRTRAISFVIDGLRPLRDPATGAVSPVCLGLGSLAPGQDHVDCYWHAEREGPHFINSTAASSGGEGDGGSLTHGLFGSLAVEPQAADAGPTQWYISQTSKAGFDAAWPQNDSPLPHDRQGALDYEATATVGGEELPVLNILKKLGSDRFEIVHNALNAAIRPDGGQAFREFTVVFHDELKTFYTRNFEELGRFTQFEGVRDGFAINYGASGLGAMILANRKGIGPAADCMECLYEEFFLESWANGDPALLEDYLDDPSNVHHSYLNDPIVFRNYHAGPKETHVFHLHAHQWFGGNDDARGAYLDSQTVAPRQGFTYRIYHGGLRDLRPGDQPATKGWWEGLGSGNRNRTVGDSIFHCHLYPHFAQGMWELWRVHDVLEDGSRKLPDGQAEAGLSTELLAREDNGKLKPIMARQGSVDDQGRYVADAAGTPIPAVIPLPDQAAPLLPTYASAEADPPVAADQAVPGYPFFIAGQPGHRAPQAPLDIAEDEAGALLSGALPRHRVETGTTRTLGIAVTLAGMAIDAATDDQGRRRVEDALYRVTAKMLALGDLTAHFDQARIRPLAQAGEPLEQAAMAFHHNGRNGTLALDLRDVRGDVTRYDPATGGYLSPAANGAEGGAALPFAVNGAPPKPGAPFADPCGAPDSFAGRVPFDPITGINAPKPMALITDPFAPALGQFLPDPKVSGYRRYAASAVQADIVTNKAGWHDPQGRLNVLTEESDGYKTLGPTAREEPFFFRAYSGECIEFRHTNELPKDLELDDFQVRTPTDTIGQHIHLVKFDVTSADGSGNGWNYEDGTFAADELAGRLCAWARSGDPDAAARLEDLKTRTRAVLTAEELADFPETTSFCDWPEVAEHKLWSLPRGRFPFLFQTTVQRWFADPILSIEDGDPTGEKADRTMRTVFTHDHFGPSSIQQHGFYSALVIEPAGKAVCAGDLTDTRPCMETEADAGGVVAGGPGGVGVHKIVTAGDDPELHPDYREFALAIADFALLYDPTDSSADDLIAAAGPLPGGTVLAGPAATRAAPRGLAKLVCEAEHRGSPFAQPSGSALELLCGTHVTRELIDGALTPVEIAELAPAMVARGLIDPPEIADLRRHFAFVRYRAGHGEGFARPVNPPARPEAISVDHHDPYLVNYRGEPVPLRIGETADDPAEPEDQPGDQPQTGKAPQDAALMPTKIAFTLAQAEGAGRSGSRKSAFDCYAERGGDVLKQFSRRAPAEPQADATGIAAPGVKPHYDAAMEQEMAAVAAAFDCSIRSQSADPRGNLGHVYRSEFFEDEIQPAGARPAEPAPATLDDTARAKAGALLRNRDHGDPATPLLETYSDERVQIRLIQGAQEVQHTFSLEGMQWRRQIDHKYPSNSVPLDSDLAGPTWWQACHDQGRKGNARQNDRWREGMLAATDDLPLWADHNRMVASCDNLEGFVAAQEVGISEHFEIPAAPSKYAVQFRKSDRLLADGAEAATKERTAALDYLFHFGSQDAIWNGAWGLMRVYETAAARDETRRLENRGLDPVCDDDGALAAEDCKVGLALKPVASDPDAASPKPSRGQQIAVANAMECPMGAPRVDAYAVAMPLPGGQKYASWEDGFRDPSALALIHVPGSLVAPYVGTGVPEDRIVGLQRQAMRYFHDEPFVIRANAGDCLRLSILNLLKSRRADLDRCNRGRVAEKGPLADCLGDAPMPRIVALNVEPNWSPTVGADEHGPADFTQDDEIDIRPSARLAMVAPVSMLTRGGDANLPFGVNQTVTEPLGAVQVSDYYLGLLRIDWQLLDALMGNAPLLPDGAASTGEEPEISQAVQQCIRRDLISDGIEGHGAAARDEAQAILRGEDGEYVVMTEASLPGGDPAARAGQVGWFPIPLLGQNYIGFVQQRAAQTRPLSVETLENVAQMTVDCVVALTSTKGLGAEADLAASFTDPEAAPVNAIPYAFGTVPLKPVGDLFNQLTHGLFGALVVEPQGASYPGRPAGLDLPAETDGGAADGAGARAMSSRSGEYTPERVRFLGKAHHGRGHNALIAFPDADGTRHQLREFVLFYQDGLNLWDQGSDSRWRPIRPAPDGRPLRIVGDCIVCDDSYDLGEKAASYLAPAYHRRLRQAQDVAVEANSDLNGLEFDPDFFAQKDQLSSNSLRMWAKPGEEVIVRVVHPGGRARQRAFVTVGNDYDDLFPGFGFPHAGLLAPGKSITASFSAPVRSGCYVWSDGPRMMDAAGAWGLLDVLTEEGMTSCGFLD